MKQHEVEPEWYKKRHVIARLVEWLGTMIAEAATLDLATVCHILLCTRDLRVQSYTLSRALERVAASPISAEQEKTDLLTAFLRQLTLQRYGISEEERQSFLDRWLHEERFRAFDIVTVAWVMGLATEQQELIRQSHLSRVREWFQRRREFESLRVRAWVPHYLELWKCHELAREHSARVLSDRRSNGSWGHDPSIDAAAAYSLSQAACVSSNDLSPTGMYLLRKLEGGFAAGTHASYALNALKFFCAQGWIVAKAMSRLRIQAEAERTVFLSHASSDKVVARRLAEDLEQHGIKVWLAEAEIKPGQSIIAKIEAGICSSRYIFLLASRASLASNWVMEEVRMAMHDGICRDQVRVVAVRLDDTPLPGFLQDKKHVNLGDNYDSAVNELLTLFGIQHAPPASCVRVTKG
jgi:hypothetical protein